MDLYYYAAGRVCCIYTRADKEHIYARSSFLHIRRFEMKEKKKEVWYAFASSRDER